MEVEKKECELSFQCGIEQTGEEEGTQVKESLRGSELAERFRKKTNTIGDKIVLNNIQFKQPPIINTSSS